MTLKFQGIYYYIYWNIMTNNNFVIGYIFQNSNDINKKWE